MNITAPEQAEDEDEEVDTGAGEGADRATLTTRSYVVVLGDYPQAIAKKIGALPARSAWWTELKAVNPHKRTAKNGWATLNAGEIINIPDEWPPSRLLRPVPGASPSMPVPAAVTPRPTPGAPPAPAFEGPTGPIAPAPTPPPGFVPLAATVDPGTISRVHSELVAWNVMTPGACSPADFGRGPDALADVSGTLTERAQHATQSFQVWTNAQRGSERKLRSDGALDPATAQAIDAWFRSRATRPEPLPSPLPAVPIPVPEPPRAAPSAPKPPRAPRAPGAPGAPAAPRAPKAPEAPPRRPSTTMPAVYEQPPPAAPPEAQEAPATTKGKGKSGASDDEVIGIAATLATVLGGFFL